MTRLSKVEAAARKCSVEELMWSQVFSCDFCESFKRLFYRTPVSGCFYTMLIWRNWRTPKTLFLKFYNQNRARTHNRGRKWLVDFNAGKTQLVSFDRSKNTGAIDVNMDGSVLEEKTSFKMLGLTFSSKLDWASCTVSIAKTASKKIGALIRSMKFLSPGVALYLYKSTIRPCMEYCCHVWAAAPSCYLELLDKLQKRICRTVGPSLAASPSLAVEM